MKKEDIKLIQTASIQLSVINYYRKQVTLIKCVCLNLKDMAVSISNVIINKDIDDLLFILLENNKSMRLLWCILTFETTLLAYWLVIYFLDKVGKRLKPRDKCLQDINSGVQLT